MIAVSGTAVGDDCTPVSDEGTIVGAGCTAGNDEGTVVGDERYSGW